MHMKKLIFISVLACLFAIISFNVSAADYCAAIRGNGELMPAHWGALAQTIETYGTPKAVAGGSSASITSFLLESVLLNPSFQKVSKQEEALRAAFLVKSFQGFTYIYLNDPKWQALLELIQNASVSGSANQRLSAVVKALGSASPEKRKKLLAAIEDLKTSALFYGPAIQKLRATTLAAKQEPSEANLAAEKVQGERVKESIGMLGKLSAKNDLAILYRDGIVNFPALANLFGRMADFYSLSSASPELQNRFSQFTRSCMENSAARTWNQIIGANPNCQKNLQSLAQEYFSTQKKGIRLKQKMGKFLPALISTAVATGDSAKELLARKAEYDTNPNAKLAEDLGLNPTEIRIAYWGSAQDLAKVANNLPKLGKLSAIDKSKRFLSLGEASWETALSFSPAEPGLSSLLPISEGKVSLGGWSDLHPVPVLKALGCEKVIYLTRKGGDSFFSQGMAKRILGFSEPSWDELDSSKKENLDRNNYGNVNDQNSQWSLMFNLANPQSSYTASLEAADAVVCTGWDSFSAKKFVEMIEESYSAPIYEKASLEHMRLKEPKLITRENGEAFPGCVVL